MQRMRLLACQMEIIDEVLNKVMRVMKLKSMHAWAGWVGFRHGTARKTCSWLCQNLCIPCHHSRLPPTYYLHLGIYSVDQPFFFFLFRHTSIHLQIYICLYIEGECIKQFHFSIPRYARQCLLSLNLKTKTQILAYDMKLTCHQIHGITTT